MTGDLIKKPVSELLAKDPSYFGRVFYIATTLKPHLVEDFLKREIPPPNIAPVRFQAELYNTLSRHHEGLFIPLGLDPKTYIMVNGVYHPSLGMSPEATREVTKEGLEKLLDLGYDRQEKTVVFDTGVGKYENGIYYCTPNLMGPNSQPSPYSGVPVPVRN